MRIIVIGVLVFIGAAANLLNLGSAISPIDPVFLRVRLLAVLCGVVFLVFMGWRYWTSFFVDALRLSFLWFLYGVIVIVSGIFHASPGFIVEGVWVSVGVPLIFFLFVPVYLGSRSYTAVISVLIISALPYLIASFISVPLSFPYRGVLGNPNQFGILVAGIGWGVLCFVKSSLFRGSVGSFVVGVVSLLVCVVLVMMSGSRSSLLSLLVASFVAVVLAVRDGGWVRFKSMTALLCIFLGLYVIVVAGVIDLSFFLEGIVGKHERKVEDSLFSGREHAWKYALDNARILGQGRSAISDGTGISAHSSFVSSLSDYGILAGIVLLLLAISGCVYAWREYNTTRFTNPHSALPLIVFVGFWTLALTEGLFGSIGRGVTIAFFLSFGIVASGNRSS